MVNKDYILRLAEKFGRTLAIVLRLRAYDKHEEALIFIDEELFRTTGLTSSFLNTLNEQTIVEALSPLGRPNIEATLGTALLLKAEGEIYEAKGNTHESYYRYVKALHLLLHLHLHAPIEDAEDIREEMNTLTHNLDAFDLPLPTRQLLFAYQEHRGFYATAEDTLFELLESTPGNTELLQQGREFYRRLDLKSDADLAAGNFSREEVQEGHEQLQRFE